MSKPTGFEKGGAVDKLAAKPTIEEGIRQVESKMAVLTLTDKALADMGTYDPERFAALFPAAGSWVRMGLIVRATIVGWTHERMSPAEWNAYVTKRLRVSRSTAFRYLQTYIGGRLGEKRVRRELLADDECLLEHFAASEEDLRELEKRDQEREKGVKIEVIRDKTTAAPRPKLEFMHRKTLEENRKLREANARLIEEKHALNQQYCAPGDELKAPEYQIAGRFKLLEKEAHHLFRTCGADRRTAIGTVILDELEAIAGHFSVDFRIWMQDGRVADYKDRLRIPRPAHIRFSQLRDPDWKTEAVHRGDDPAEIDARYEQAKKTEPYEGEE